MLPVSERIEPVGVKFLSGSFEGDRAEFFFARDIEAAIEIVARAQYGRASGVHVARKRIEGPNGKWLSADWLVYCKDVDQVYLGKLRLDYDLFDEGSFEVSRDDAPEHISFKVQRARLKVWLELDLGPGYEGPFRPVELAESLYLLAGFGWLGKAAQEIVDARIGKMIDGAILVEPDHYERYVPLISANLAAEWGMIETNYG